jgi:hypothetical protein
MNFIPVSPLRTAAGDLVSLDAFRKNLRAAPIDLDAGATISNVVVSFGGQEISASLAATLGVGTVFTGSVKANEYAYWLDAFAFADSRTTPSTDNLVIKTRWGYGLRIVFRARKLDASATLSYSILGAQVQFGVASADYEVQTIGLGPGALVAILGGLSQFGTLNGDTFHDLNTIVIDKLRGVISAPGSSFTARPLAVQVSTVLEIDSVVKAKAEIFAMRRIASKLSLNDALQKAGALYDADTIKAVYKAEVGDVSPDQKPSDSARDAASAWLQPIG